MCVSLRAGVVTPNRGRAAGGKGGGNKYTASDGGGAKSPATSSAYSGGRNDGMRGGVTGVMNAQAVSEALRKLREKM